MPTASSTNTTTIPQSMYAQGLTTIGGSMTNTVFSPGQYTYYPNYWDNILQIRGTNAKLTLDKDFERTITKLKMFQEFVMKVIFIDLERRMKEELIEHSTLTL